MKVTVTYYDTQAYLREEIEQDARRLYGENVQVKVEPVSDSYLDMLHYALAGLMSNDQIADYFESGALYPQRLAKLRKDTLEIVENEMDAVIIENEERFAS